jgi:hypothetical protein
VASGRVYLFDLKTLKPIGQVKVDRDADSILYDPFSKRIFCFNGEPNSATVIDPATGAVVSTLALGGAPEPAVADGKGMIYDNLEDKNEVIAIDSRTLKITARWPVAPAGRPVGFDRHGPAAAGQARHLSLVDLRTVTASRGWPDLRQNHIHRPGQANSGQGPFTSPSDSRANCCGARARRIGSFEIQNLVW